jgi:DNA polymerase-3 subunit epsilon
LPGLKSHSLASLCQFYQIKNQRAHRALEDAEATTRIFFELNQISGFELVIKEFLNRKSKEMSLPPHVKKESFTNLPETIGVYIFSDNKGKVVYVGKANHIKDRVSQHFSGNTHTKGKQAFLNNIFEVDFKETGHELMALLLENELIKKHYPRFNSTNKDFNLNFGIYQYADQKGFIRLVVGESGKWSQPVSVFRTKAEATLMLLKTSMKNGLCLAFNQLLPGKNAQCNYENEDGQKCLICFEKASVEMYNATIEMALENWNEGKSFILQMPGRQKEEMGLVWVKSGKISGYGYMPIDQDALEMSDLKPFLQSYYDTQDAQSILKPFLSKARKMGVLEDGVEVLELG